MLLSCRRAFLFQSVFSLNFVLGFKELDRYQGFFFDFFLERGTDIEPLKCNAMQPSTLNACQYGYTNNTPRTAHDPPMTMRTTPHST